MSFLPSSGTAYQRPTQNPMAFSNHREDSGGSDLVGLLTGTTPGATRGDGDITSIVTGGQFNNVDSRTIQNQDNIQSIYDFLGGNMLNSQLEAQRNQILNEYGITQGYEQLARQGLLTDAELAQRGLGINRQGLGIQQGAANRDLSAISQLLGINDASLGRNINSVEQLLELVWQGRDLEKEGIRHNKGMQQRALRDDATARGAFNAPGTRQSFTDIEKEANLAQRAANIGARQSEIGLYDRAGDAREGHARTRIGLNRQAGDANDTLRRLDLEAQRLNLSADQIQSTLDQGLQRLGLESMTNASDLITRLNSANIEQATMAANLLAQAAQLAGLDGIADIVGGGGTGGTGSSTGSTGGSTTRPR